MCGIFCILSPSNDCNKTEFIENNENSRVNIERRGPDYQNSQFISLKNWDFLLSTSILWLQGENLTAQPIETEKSWFLFNGDIFDEKNLSLDIRQKYGDTKPLLDLIENSENIAESLTRIFGPYAFILVDKLNFKLYFGRDTFGRRSLLIGKNINKLLLTSVASKKVSFPVIELPALGVYCIDLNSTNLSTIILHPWRIQNQHFEEKLRELRDFLSLDIDFDHKYEPIANILDREISTDDEIFLQSIEKLKTNEALPLIENNVRWCSNILKLKQLLTDAIERRINNQPKFCNDCLKEKLFCQHATIGVLFSGGLDCAILTLLADRFIEPFRQIDLMNVAFEKGNSYNTPDRLTARQTLEELKRLCPERQWNLLEINISKEELNLERSRHINDLIFPLESILDESLGCALWFAARGKTETYNSPCRVLLVGMGADELFGGYTRHRAAYKRGCWSELTKELDNDWKNISHRNLARDDRVISDHGRQVRTPYLDENVVDFVRNLSAWERCYPSEKVEQGLGDKLLLRSLAFHLGLVQAAGFRKRALQFGSRIANSKENAHEKSPRL